MIRIPTVRELLEGGDLRGRRPHANTQGRRPVDPPSPTRASGPVAPALDRTEAAATAGPADGTFAVLSLHDLRRLCQLIVQELQLQPAPIALSLRDAARAVGVSVPTLRRAIRSGALVARRVGGRVLIEPEALREWVRRSPQTGRE